MKIKDINHLLQTTDCRIENETTSDEVYLTIVDRKLFPRLWIDNDLDGAKTIAESVDHLLLKNNPLLEKDWTVRFIGDSIEDCINQYNTYLNE